MGDSWLMATGAFLKQFLAPLLPWLPAVFGALISLRFLGSSMTLLQRVICFFIGILWAHYIGSGIIEWMSITSSALSDAIKFACGLFGFAVVREAFKEIEQANILQTLRDKIIDRFLGKKP